LAAIDIHNNEIRFEVPVALQKYQHKGQVYHLQGQQLDTVVTLDHRLVVKRRHKDSSWTEAYFENAADVIGKPRRYLKSGNLAKCDRTTWSNPWHLDKKQFAKLVGFFVGDGMKPRPANQIRFRLKKQRKIDFLHSIGIPIEAKAGDRYTVNLPGIGKWFRDKCFNATGDKCLPDGYLKLTATEVEGLLEGLRNSDGNEQANTWRYSSSSIFLLGQLQALLHINNLSGHWSLAYQENEKHQAGYYLNVSNRISPRVEISQNGRSLSYSESVEKYDGFVYCATVSTGALIVRRNRKVMVSGNCLEHPQIVVNVGYFPHSMMQQIRTHRHLSMDVQSFRYTGSRVIEVAEGKKDVEDVFYLRPVGNYTNRQGKRYFYSEEQRNEDIEWCLKACQHYQKRINEGLSEEHARGLIPFDARQHFVLSCNLRSLLHLLDLRWKKDAQLEAQKFCELLYTHLEDWTPAVAQWYLENRAKKARLAP
ncbi:MAG: FAD-dependent thymidylate synthase, partial [Spirulinaceae cyanobacterium]